MPFKFEENVLGLIPQADWLNVGSNVTRPNDPFDAIIGDQKTEHLVAEWETIAAEYQIPVMAQFHAFDTEAQKTFRIPIDSHNIEKGLIKVKLDQSERLRALMNHGVQKEESLYKAVFNDGFRLADQVFTRSKVAKAEMLATGKVTIHENDLNLTVDYGTNEEQHVEIDFGDDQDVLAQIEAIIETALEAGVTINGMITSKAMLTKIRKHPSVQKAINGTLMQGITVRESQLIDYLASEFGVTRIIENDNVYGVEDGKDALGRPKIKKERYFPNDVITFVAFSNGGQLGVGLWGNPPEIDAANFFKVGASQVSPYVFVSQWAEKDPAVIWTKATGLFMPVLYSPTSLWFAKAKSGE